VTTFRIDYQCPQCGAPANLEETDRLFACPFCRVRSFLLTRDYFRYVLPAKNPADKDLIYFPYWRFKGTLLFSLPSGNEHKFLDVNQSAVDIPGAPATLGLRAQAMKLKFLSQDLTGRFISPTQSFSETFTAFQARCSQTLPKPILYSAHLGESMGLLYSPFYVRDRLYDAVLDQPVGNGNRFPSARLADNELKDEKQNWRVNFVPALCPDCGWDLEGERSALVLHCRNCTSSWYPSGEKLTRVQSDCLESAETGLFYLPFWQITCEMSDISLKNYGDLAKVANLPKLIDSSVAGREFRFWAPAFKLRAQAFLRLAGCFTLAQAQGLLAPALPPERHHAVTLPVEEACESLKVILAGFLKPRRRVAEMLTRITIHPTHFRLAYLPFNENQHDYIQVQTGQAVNKNLLSLSCHL
jgi:DNA-directed RNA polymerase subunit RPC12/RpoP